MNKIIITIDGYSSCGKSTLAKQIAKELNYVFIDSGAMYRAITLFFIRNQVDLTSVTSIEAALNQIELSFAYNAEKGTSDMILNGENVEVPIREMAVSNQVSQIAALKEVREFSVAQQQLNGQKKGIVMDGRDIGTVVFPHAELKIFLTADPEVRVERRYKELQSKNSTITKEEIKANLEMRDYQDTHRDISPLRQAEDAVLLDNSQLNMDDQLQLVLGWVNDKIQKAS